MGRWSLGWFRCGWMGRWSLSWFRRSRIMRWSMGWLSSRWIVTWFHGRLWCWTCCHASIIGNALHSMMLAFADYRWFILSAAFNVIVLTSMIERAVLADDIHATVWTIIMSGSRTFGWLGRCRIMRRSLGWISSSRMTRWTLRWIMGRSMGWLSGSWVMRWTLRRFSGRRIVRWSLGR